MYTFLNRYTRNLVDNGNGKYNLMLLCWGEGHGSSIHDHADSHCFMKMLQGSLIETRFAWPQEKNEELKEISRKQLHLNELCYMNGTQLSNKQLVIKLINNTFLIRFIGFTSSRECI